MRLRLFRSRACPPESRRGRQTRFKSCMLSSGRGLDANGTALASGSARVALCLSNSRAMCSATGRGCRCTREGPPVSVGACADGARALLVARACPTSQHAAEPAALTMRHTGSVNATANTASGDRVGAAPAVSGPLSRTTEEMKTACIGSYKRVKGRSHTV